ncbi:MAG: hypothetical protein NVSMB26_09700 [Beijerinckiaceae bacterium]
MSSSKPKVASDVDAASLKAQVACGIRAAGLTLAPAWQDGIEAHFEAIAKAAALIMEFHLDEDVEPAAVYSA